MRFAHLLTLAAFAFGAGPAFAQPHAQANSSSGSEIAGAWTFEVGLDPDGACHIVGDARLTPRGGAGEFDVTLHTHETCTFGAEWRSEQSCRATQTDAKVWLECEVVSATPANYFADDFSLEIASPELMQGWLISAGRGRAVWRRPTPQRIS